MNVYDSGRMADILAPVGYAPTESAETADMIILNTCHIREKAAEKVYSELGRLAQLKQKHADVGKDLIIALAGCVAQAEGEEVSKRAPCVDIILGPQVYHRLPELVAKASRSKRAVLDTEFPAISKFDHMSEELVAAGEGRGIIGYITIQEGCDRFCTFCVVPYTRGAEYSRPLKDIIDEANRLISNGAKEIVLLGQNVNAYHGLDFKGNEIGLDKLIRNISKLPGIERIRYTTSHPKDMNNQLIETHGDLPQLMPFLHLPVQSGSDRILKSMNRQHSSSDYLKIIEKLRDVRPDISFSSDFIVGYPGETESDFRATLDLIKEVNYAQAFSFKYSPRPGTPAADISDQIPTSVKDSRLAELQELVNYQQRIYNNSHVGYKLPVLFERFGKDPGQISGRSPYMQWVHVNGYKMQIGTITEVIITEGRTKSLMGKSVGSSEPTNINNHISSELQSPK